MAISVGSAVGAGFNLLGKRPLSVVAWGFFNYFSVFILFGIGVAIVGVPVLSKILAAGGNPDPTQAAQIMMTLFLSLWPALALVMIGSLFVGAMLQAAVIRSILHPDDKRLASLRFGREEGALVLLFLLYIPIAIVIWLVTAAVVVASVFVGRAIHGFGGGLVVFIVCVAYAVGLFWVALRFSMAAPMTFAEGRVRFFGSWALTRGEGWRLYGLAWLMVLVIVGVSIVYGIISSIVQLVFVGAALTSVIASAGGGPNGSPNPAAIMAALPMLLLAYIPSFLLGAAFNGVLMAISQSPWADVYRQLKGQPDVAATFT
jgi:hypothetical protein